MYKYNLNDVECGDLFIYDLFNLVRGNATDLSKRSLQELSKDSYAVISAKDQNNALLGFSKLKNGEVVYKNVITVNNNGSVGYSFYHAYTFIASSDVSVLIPKCDIDPAAMIFITRCLQNVAIEKFAYGYKAANDRLRKTKILLPIDQNNNPNWEYMDNFIDELDKKYSIQLSHYFNLKLDDIMGSENSKNLRGGVTYKEFFIGEVFKITSTSSGIDKNKLINGSGKIPYVTRSEIDNGINLFVSDVQDSKYKKDPGNVITIGLDTQTVFYQQNTFYTGEKVQILYNKNLNKYNAMFLIPFLQLQMRKFIWGKGASLVRLNKTKILLPINQNNEPDWQFMEEVGKNIEAKKIIEIMQGLNTIHNPQVHI